MPTINVYISEEDQRRIWEAHKDEGENAPSVSQIGTCLLRWYAKSPDTPLRRTAGNYL